MIIFYRLAIASISGRFAMRTQGFQFGKALLQGDEHLKRSGQR
jgi:hypothetical protein